MLQSLFEIILTNIAPNLPQDAAALVINNRCGAGIDDNVFTPRDFDGKCFVQGVAGQGRAGHAVKKLLPRVPLGAVVVHHAESKKSGKTFVEPEIFPIGRGYQVAEPLVGNFMGDDFKNSFLAGLGSDIRIMQQQVFAEGNRPPIFHGPEGKIRNGDQVHFGQRIGDSVIGFAEFKGLAAQIGTKMGKFLHPGQGGYPYPVIFFIRGKFKLADPEKNEVGRHFGGLFKGDPHFSVVEHLGFFYGTVGDGHQMGLDVDGDVKSGLAGGMIHTGKSPAGVTFFKLGDGHIPALILI